MEVSVSSQLGMCRYPSKVLETEPAVPMVAITVHLHTPSPLTRVRVNLHVTQPLVLSQNTHTITSLTDTETLRIFAFLSDTPIVSSLELNVVTTYMSADGVPHSLHQSVQLPLSLVITVLLSRMLTSRLLLALTSLQSASWNCSLSLCWTVPWPMLQGSSCMVDLLSLFFHQRHLKDTDCNLKTSLQLGSWLILSRDDWNKNLKSRMDLLT